MLCRSIKLHNSLLWIRTFSELPENVSPKTDVDIFDVNKIEVPEEVAIPIRKPVLEDCNEDISHIAPYLKPTFNFAAYANKSETLQQFVKLGVDLHKWEMKRDVLPYILTLKFEEDVQNHLLFLSDLGVPAEEFSRFLTKNPFFFKEDLDNLHVRINYLKSKRFTSEMITRIISKNPFWLSFSTQDINDRLGFFQTHFGLTGNEVRSLTAHHPRIITYSLENIKLNTFAVKEEMGFTSEQTKAILLKKPDIFMKSQKNLLKTFEFIHRKMNIPLERIAEFPGVLTCRLFKIRQRHLFLKQLGKDQYNFKEPNYVSLLGLVSGSDAEFSTEIAKSSIQAYNMFLKTE